ncbi:DegT/DnrJ/EryC1/StrS family aminotransferase [Campylobacter fetus]|nr:DegT/DnrJ/EryC1/StrS family aminotransferase [Campylobacter fetus]
MKMINWWSNNFDEKEIKAVSDAILSKCISQGDITDKFEKELAKFLQVPYCICVPNGTQAITLSFMACGIEYGDEIITSNRTFIGTAHAGLILGAKIVAVDVKDDMSIDYNLIENKITNKTKLIVPVHLNGIANDMEAISKIADDNKITIVEDACQAFGSKYNGKFLGTFGRFGCFSLGIAKVLSTGQGGVVTANNEEDYKLLQKIRNQGVFDVRKEQNYGIKAFNFKFNDMQAAIGLAQLSKINEKIETCKDIYQTYKEKLDGKINYVQCNLESTMPMRFLVLHQRNQELKEWLMNQGIGSSLDAPSLNLCPHLNISGKYPISNKFHKELLILPSGPSQKISDINKVANKVLEWLGV